VLAGSGMSYICNENIKQVTVMVVIPSTEEATEQGGPPTEM